MNGKIISGIVIVLVVIAGWFALKSMNSVPENTPTPTPTATASNTPDISPVASSTAMPVESTPMDDKTTNDTASETKEFTVTGKPFSFTPSTLTVNKGDTVKIIFKNEGGMHDWKVDEFEAATKVLQAGGQEAITFVANKTGSFEYYCSVGQHRQMGMKGTLIVK